MLQRQALQKQSGMSHAYKSALGHHCLKTYEPLQPLTWPHAAHQCQARYTSSTVARPANPNKNQTQSMPRY